VNELSRVAARMRSSRESNLRPVDRSALTALRHRPDHRLMLLTASCMKMKAKLKHKPVLKNIPVLNVYCKVTPEKN